MSAPLSRGVARATRQAADQQQQIAAAVLAVGGFFATVTSITPGTGRGGSAVIAVTYQGQQNTAAGYAASYTPVLNDRVLCLPVQSQPVVICSITGQP